MFYTYVLQSEKDGQKYVGYTADLAVRFEQHSRGQVESTAHRRPLKLVYYEACLRKEDALCREVHLKTFYGRQYLAKRLKAYFTGLDPSV